VRDDFSQRIKRTLQTRAGHHCSNSGCQRPTAGPGQTADATINIGVAAHITAASPGTPDNPAPRYDKSLTPRERSDISNGVWLCQNCAKLIDSDVPRFPAELLRKWKQEAEERAFLAVSTSATHVPISFSELDEADKRFLSDLALPEEEGIEAVTERLKHAAREDLAAFRSTRAWPAHAVELGLMLSANGRRDAISLTGVATAIGVVDRLSVISSPGSGKTITLIQLADRIIDIGQAVPLLVPLAEWSGNREGFFEFVTHRNAFRNFRQQHFQLLAFYGRLILLVDGWNEADSASRTHASRQLNALSRDFPLLSIVIATRQQSVPTAGPMLEIDRLREDQQLEIARRVLGGTRETVLERAWCIPGIRELISTPLYLNALLAGTQERSFPQTKEAILSTFVTEHESAPEKAEVLRTELFGCHKQMLTGLAVQANRLGTSVATDEEARRAVSQVGAKLVSMGQISESPQPTVVLDVLVNTHSLVRAPNGSLSFQHQQFQEWYASFEVEQLMVKAAEGGREANRTLRTEILNWLPWEEAVLFACERLSRKGAAGAKAVGATIAETLGIDPMLAVEMIFRSGEMVWPEIKDQVLDLAERWHRPGQVDRAVRFMVTTGRPEFSTQIWPLISNPDRQIHLAALRKADRFRPSVLGPEACNRLGERPDNIRGEILASIARESGPDGLELVTQAARADPDANVVVEIIHAFAFRRADRHVAEILATATDAVWCRLANARHRIGLIDPSQRARLAALMAAQRDPEADPVQAVVRLAGILVPEDAIGERIVGLVEHAFFPGKTQQGAFAIKRAFEKYPDHTRRALFNRIQAGLPVPNGIEDFLKNAPHIDEGPVAAAALDNFALEPLVRFAPTLIGSEAIGKVLDQLFLLDARGRAEDWRDEPTRNEYWRLKDVVAATRQVPFVQALVKRAESDNPHRIQLMADLLARHGRPGEESQAFQKDLRQALAKAIELWINTLMTSSDANRHQLADVARAVERVPQPAFAGALDRMLQRDFADWARARENFKKSPRRGPIGPDVTMSYTLQYARAFAAIGGAEVVALMKRYLPDMRFGIDAAWVLGGIWRKENGPVEERPLGGWNNFASASANRLLRQNTRNPPPTTDAAEAIFNVVRECGTDKSDTAAQRHAIELATAALSIPHGSKRAEIDSLMALPLPFSAKRGLLTAAAEAGEIVRIQDLIDAVKELLELAKKEPWHVDKNSGELMGWLALFPFSDRPTAVIEMLQQVPRQYCEPWDLDRLLIALADSPHEDVLLVFKALADWDQRVLNNHHWLYALLKIGTEAAASLIIELICDGRFPARDGFPERHVSDLVKRYPSVHGLILQRYTGMQPGRSQSTLESILLEIADPEIVLALIRTYARNGRSFHGNLAHAIHEAAIGRRTAPDWPGAYYQFSFPLTDLRKELFSLVLTNGPESALALACLNEIEELRDEHGRVNDEPRHSDIESGHPLPLEPATPNVEEPGQPSRRIVRLQL
jgi:hypothetical protein